MSKIIGIYKITSPSGRVYIGQSKDIKNRHSCYKTLKCKNQPIVYNSLLKHGFDNHIFEIIEECDIEDLTKKERFWQEFYNVIDRDKGMNCLIVSYDGEKAIYSEDMLQRMSEVQKGNTRSKESIEKQLATRKRLFESTPRKPKKKKKSVKDNPDYIFHLGEKVECIDTGRIWNSVSELAKELGVNKSSLRDKIANKVANQTPYFYVKDKDRASEVCKQPKGVPFGGKTVRRAKDNYLSKPVICIVTGEVWESCTACAKENNIKMATLSWNLNRPEKNKTTFKYYNE